MPRCQSCGNSMVRTHRTAFEKLLYSIVLKCKICGLRVGESHRVLNHFARFCRCPECGTEDLSRRTTRDKIDKMRWTPMSILHRLLRGSLYHCTFCRIQFYDVRGRATPGKHSADPNC